jgi:hypothetical protein
MWGPPTAVFAAVAAIVMYVAMVDPNEQGHYPGCPFRYLTGYYCPGCGSLRMIHAATHGHLGEAFGRNPLAFTFIPVLGYLWVRWTASAVRGRPMGFVLFRPWLIWAFVLLILAFWLLRNLPVGQALAP